MYSSINLVKRTHNASILKESSIPYIHFFCLHRRPSAELLEREINLAKLEILNHPITVRLKSEAATRQKLAEKVKQAREHALQIDQEKAEKGDAVGLRRMGERYRNGEGIEKDAAKSAALLKKADEADEIEIQKNNSENQAKEENQKRQKFAWAIDQAEKGGVSGMILAGKCYRDGIGITKDLTKATEYFRKAENAGSSEASQLIETCK